MLNINLANLNTGGYCFGNKLYIRNMLREYVNKELVVIPARKLGLDVPRTALSILYDGRNITDHLIYLLTIEKIVTKSDDDELLFIKTDQTENWTFDDLKETEGVYCELHQESFEIDRILRQCLNRCESFKGDIDLMRIKFDRKIMSEEPVFIILYRRHNITGSLMQKLLDLHLLYDDNGRYLLMTDSKATVGMNYQMNVILHNILHYFVPLIFISCIVLMFAGGIIAGLTLFGGIIYFAISQYWANKPEAQQRKAKVVEEKIIYIGKWTLILVIGSPLLVIFLNTIGLILIIAILIFAIYRYKKIFE